MTKELDEGGELSFSTLGEKKKPTTPTTHLVQQLDLMRPLPLIQT